MFKVKHSLAQVVVFLSVNSELKENQSGDFLGITTKQICLYYSSAVLTMPFIQAHELTFDPQFGLLGKW